MTVVTVREERGGSRGGAEPLAWNLYTTYPVNSLEDARLVVQNYVLRWRIERHHFTTKSGALRLPQSQLRSWEARRKWILMSTSVSARLQHVMYRARTEPDVSALEEFEEEELEAVVCLLEGRRMKASFSTPKEAKLGQVVEAVATLGGYQGKRRTGGPAGIQTLARGWTQVEVAKTVLAAHRHRLDAQGARDEPHG